MSSSRKKSHKDKHKDNDADNSTSRSSSSSSAPTSALPSDLYDLHHHVSIGASAASNTTSVSDAQAYEAYGVSNAWDMQHFKQHFRIDVVESNKNEIVFDVVGIDASLANAFRRILLSEVPTMAFEKVIMFQNTSIIPDEVLAHRLGLIPLRADARLFQYKHENNQVANELNTLVFTLSVSCTRQPHSSPTAAAADQYTHSLVTSADLVWVPQGRQQAVHATSGAIAPHYNDIVIAKLRPGQTIECELHAEKGTGQVHAKWSPVATASYRLLPHITFNQPIVDDDALQLVAKCPMRVFDIEDVAGGPAAGASRKGITKQAVVARPRNCSMCRECIREEGWQDRINLRRVRDHFIFSVETTGAYSPPDVVKEAVKVLQEKVKRVKQFLTDKIKEEDHTMDHATATARPSS